MATHYGQPLKATVADGRLIIEIGVEVLAHAVSYADWANQYDESRGDYFRTFAIADPNGFAADVVGELLREREDGSSLLTDLLDKASEAALDNGSEHCEFDQRIKTGEFSPLETWASKAEGRDEA